MRANDAISIVIPAHNEAQRLPATLRRLLDYAGANEGAVAEIIVVDDGSRDATAAVANEFVTVALPLRVVRYSKNCGKGYAIRRGVLAATGNLVLLTDADLSTPIEEIGKLLAAMEDHEIAIGSRAIDETLVRKRQSLLRQQMGRTFNRLVRAITRIPFGDTQCGFKLLRREAARQIFQLSVVDRFAWDVEMLILASRFGFRIAEVPVLWFNSPDSRVHLIRDSARMLRDVLRIRRLHGTFRA